MQWTSDPLPKHKVTTPFPNFLDTFKFAEHARLILQSRDAKKRQALQTLCLKEASRWGCRIQSRFMRRYTDGGTEGKIPSAVALLRVFLSHTWQRSAGITGHHFGLLIQPVTNIKSKRSEPGPWMTERRRWELARSAMQVWGSSRKVTQKGKGKSLKTGDPPCNL